MRGILLSAAGLLLCCVAPDLRALVVEDFQLDSSTLEERIDLYHPSTGAYLGSERTWFGADGRRLRLEVTDAQGAVTLLFIVRHDERGRESEAIYFESDPEPDREVFTYSDDGLRKTTTYYYDPGVAADRTESELDGRGREIRKQYFRADGSQYGEEDVLWNADGTQLGWDFRYLGRDGGASFRFSYEAIDPRGGWSRRIRSRDGVPDRVEVRTRVTTSIESITATPVPFAPDAVSSGRSETSPSFSWDGTVMVFARYGDDWETKDPHIAYLEDGAWRVERLADIGPVYNLAISPDGQTVIYAIASVGARTLHRIRRTARGWSPPQDLTAAFGLVGAYPCLTDDGDLFLFSAEGAAGAGIYAAARDGDGFAPPRPVFVRDDAPFDGYTADDGRSLLVTRCFDEACLSGPKNGIWEISLDDPDDPKERKLPNLPYAWGAQPVESLGLFVFTDGEDILAIPLLVARLNW